MPGSSGLSNHNCERSRRGAPGFAWSSAMPVSSLFGSQHLSLYRRRAGCAAACAGKHYTRREDRRQETREERHMAARYGTPYKNTMGFWGNVDEVHGLGGDDTLDGRWGSGRMYGGTDNDIYYIDGTN